MTRAWTMPPEPPRRRRRAVIAVGLVAVFLGSLAVGWAAADPGAFGGAIAAATGGRPGDGDPAGAPGAATGSPTTPVATTAPTTQPAPTASPSPTPSPTPTASPTPEPTPIPEPTVPPKLAAKLDRALARAKTSLLLPGVEATVLFPDGSSWTGSLGQADVATKRPVRDTTPFAIASVTKTFTSALVLRYVDEGRLDLDDPIARWLPDWPNAKKITVRMLLNHTSGIPDFFKNPKFDAALNKSKKKAWTVEDVLTGYVRSGVVFAPGKGWSYSNTNYVLLGLIAEEIGGAPWHELVHRELTEPLGLTSTFVQAVEEPAAAPALAYRVVAGNNGWSMVARTDGTDIVPFTSVVTAAGSAGAMASTTADLARWAKALYGGSLLTKETRKEMLTFVRAYAYGLGTSYGLGVSRVKMDGHTAYGHTGALAGTRASIRYFPKEKIAVAVLFNRETYVGDDVVRILARALFPAATATPKPTPAP